MFDLTPLLELAALILSIINGIALLSNHLRDQAILKVKPIHPDVYQWWVRLPAREYEGAPTRRFGFLLYVGIGNQGLRKVALDSWRLFIQTNATRSKQELKPLSIPEPITDLGSYAKSYNVLGLRGALGSGETVIDSGCSISGWVYYVAEYFGDETWNPVIKNGKIKGTFVVRDIFKGKTQTEIVFSEKELSFVQKMIPSIENIG
jgi:hypothetical protein